MKIKNFEKFSKKKINNIFVRWGGANAVRQKGKRGPFGFHSPPASRGIYAFPIKAIEQFLSAHRSKERHSHIRYDGEIWHHLEEHVKVADIIQRQGSWVLTSFKTWDKAFRKEMLKLKLQGWGGKINYTGETEGMLTTYWRYYMRHKYHSINDKDNPDYYINQPLIYDKIQRYRNNIAPTKSDLEDADFVEAFNNGDDKDFLMSYKEFTEGKSSIHTGGYSKDHLEVFLPEVS